MLAEETAVMTSRANCPNEHPAAAAPPVFAAQMTLSDVWWPLNAAAIFSSDGASCRVLHHLTSGRCRYRCSSPMRTPLGSSPSPLSVAGGF
uniref:Uncharacterized protein n=1 Tax=Arundo donax TaxID=35708 RepID=A0A0A9CBC4_ARUDO